MLEKGWRKFWKTFWGYLGTTVWFTRRIWILGGLLLWILLPLTPWSRNLWPRNGAGCENYVKVSGEPCLFFQGVGPEHYPLGSFCSVDPINNFLLPHGATPRLILCLRGSPSVLSSNLLFCLWTSAASWLWSQMVSVGTSVGTLSDLLAVWQYHHYSVGGFGFGPQGFQDLALGKWLLPGVPKNLSWRASQWMAAVECGSSVPTRAGKSVRAVNAERLSWGAMDGALAFGAAELLWEML